MLTASLQSTWDTQRSIHKKYGTATYNYMTNGGNSSANNVSESEGKNENYKQNSANQPHIYYANSNYSELPNLKLSAQQSGSNRLLLQGSTPNGPLIASLSSPRGNNNNNNAGNSNSQSNQSRQQQEPINFQYKKNRTNSRQSSQKTSRKYKSDGYQTMDAASNSATANNQSNMNYASGPLEGTAGLHILPQISSLSSMNAANNSVKKSMYINGSVSSPSNVTSNTKAQGNPLLSDSSSNMFSNSSSSGSLVSPVVREFTTTGNVLTATEEHAHAGITSIRGLKPANPNWINQDNFFVVENFDGRDVRIYCVLDGHGEHGHLVSRRCKENFPLFIKSSKMDMDNAFKMMQNDLNTASDMDVRCSGATCVLATIYNGKLSVYNCGDSRAVLGRKNPNGSMAPVALSKDHKPDKADERKRILSCGGHLGCRQVLVNQPGRGPVSMPVGPCRVWYQHRGETLGLAMSRSLGDTIVHKSGVSAEPEISERMIDEFDDFFILATDGVWDVVDNNYAVQIIHSFVVKSSNWSTFEAANAICRYARSRWEKLSPMIDDITCIVVKIHR